MVLEYIDVKDFKKGNYIDKDGNFIEQRKDLYNKSKDSMYMKYIEFKNSYLGLFKVYHKTGLIHTEIKYFHDYEFGKSKEYDINGYFIKEEDYNEGYNFSIYNLRELICEEYGVDLMNKPDIYKTKYDYFVRRKEIFGKKSYSILFYNISGEITKSVNVDGNTGEIICENNIILNEVNPIWKEIFPKSKTPQKQYMDLKNSLKK